MNNRDIPITTRDVWKIVEETDHAVHVKRVKEQVKRNVDTGAYRHRELTIREREWFFKDNKSKWPREVKAAHNVETDRYPEEYTA